MLLINLAQNVEGKRINNQAATFLGGHSRGLLSYYYSCDCATACSELGRSFVKLCVHCWRIFFSQFKVMSGW